MRQLSWSQRSRGASFDFSPDSTHSDSGRAESDNDFLRPPRSIRQRSQQRLSRASSLSPRRNSRQRNSSLSARVTNRPPVRGFTRDWIDQFLSGAPRTERSHWLSDDSDSDSNSFLNADHYLHEELSDDWLGLGEGGNWSSRSRRQRSSVDSKKTPREGDRFRGAKRSYNRVDRARTGDRRTGHERTKTVRQEDIWGFAYDQDSPRATTDMASEAGNDGPPATEKPLPPIPREVSSQASSFLAPPETHPQSDGARPVSPRPKKRKVAWRGKTCIIALPTDDKRGSEYRLFTAEDVRQRLRAWQDQGYDVHGFTVTSAEESFTNDLGGLSRPTHPDPAECQDEWKARKYKICFPDKAEWDAYVKFLQEEKLRSLGVSFGDDEEEVELGDKSQLPVSPIPVAVSQTAAAAFPGLVATPPLPTASLAGSLVHPFSPAEVGVGIGSLTSPSSQLAGTPVPFFGVDQGVLESYHQYPFQPTPLAQGLFNPAAMPGNMPNLSSILSSASALNSRSYTFPQADDSFEGQFDPAGIDGEDPSLQSPPSFSENEPQVPAPPSGFHNVELAHPTPRGHGYNLSETLQKGLDEAQQQGESSGNNNLESAIGLMSSRWAVPDYDSDHHRRSHGSGFPQSDQRLDFFHDKSTSDNHGENSLLETTDIGINSSLSGTPRRSWRTMARTAGSQGGKHQSRLSVSSLNVEAKEFNPVDFSFQPSGLQGLRPAEMSMSTFSSAHNPSASVSRPLKEQNMPRQGTFKFSSASFNVDAPVFNPSSSFNSTDTGGEGASRIKIFDNIDLSQLSRPSKKSSAIPIVRPDDAGHVSLERGHPGKRNDQEDPSGRHKRTRRDEGDTKLNMPVSMLVETSNLSQASPGSNNTSLPSAEDKENRAPTVVPSGSAADENEIPMPVHSGRQTKRFQSLASKSSTWLSEQQQQQQATTARRAAPLQEKENEELPGKTGREAKQSESSAGFVDSTHPEGDSVSETDEGEIEAIMDQLNGDSDIGVQREDSPDLDDKKPGTASGRHFASEESTQHPSPRHAWAPNTAAEPGAFGSADGSRAAWSPQKNLANGIQSSVQQLIFDNGHISDWGDMISPSEDEKLAAKSKFLGRRVDDLDVGGSRILEERLISLERTLGIIQQSMATMITKAANRKGSRTLSLGNEDTEADADDEEEEEEEGSGRFSSRGKSSLDRNDRKFDRLKSVVTEALAAIPRQEVSELGHLRDSIAGLKELASQKFSEGSADDLRGMVQEAVAEQFDVRKSEVEQMGTENLVLQIDTLKRMLRVADERSEDEYKQRRESQESTAELKRLLQIAEGEASRHSEAAEAAESRLLQFKEEKMSHVEKLQAESLSLAQERDSLQLTLNELSSKNIVLQNNFDEDRVSSDNWKRENESLKQANKELLIAVDHLKVRIDDSIAARQDMRGKLDRLQDDMASAVHDIGREHAAWQKREEEQAVRYEGLRATYEREKKLREKLEYDVNELEKQEREATKLKFIFGQSQQENARLEELAANLRVENHDLEVKAARFEREFNEARESSRAEIQRIRTSFEVDLESANSQVNIVRAEGEAHAIRMQSQLDNVRLHGDTTQQRYEMLLEGATKAREAALAAAADASHAGLAEQSLLHERALDRLREEHEHVLHRELQNHQREEAHLAERLAFSEEKAQHYQDRAHAVQEKLDAANSAFVATAQGSGASASTSSSAPPVETEELALPSMTFQRGSLVPDKISPQALRESILVLQDQLHHRETRIDELEQELSLVDKELPTKLKAKDSEITWLRELMGVRIDDLQDIIDTVSRPSFDQDAVRNAAIRLKANLQMQQQEQERALFGGSGGPSLPYIPSSITSLAASPRSLPLAAAAALGGWRKHRERSDSNHMEVTPSKPSITSSTTGSAASAFLSGLLTPPASVLRQQNNESPTKSRRGGGNNNNGDDDGEDDDDDKKSSRAPSTGTATLRTFAPTPMRPLSSVRQRQQQQNATSDGGRSQSTTPPLLRKSSYDHDADPTSYDDGVFGGALMSVGGQDSGDGGGGGETASDDRSQSREDKAAGGESS